MAACGSSPSSAPTSAVPSALSSSAASLLARVGDKPRGYASVDLHKLNIFEPMAGQADADEAIKALKACGIDLAKLDRVRVAIGEPLRIAAEIDGTIEGFDGAEDEDGRAASGEKPRPAWLPTTRSPGRLSLGVEATVRP